ncbi:MAG: DUF2207 domain-containing protein [Candidatus Berkelbacteria bacterium]|nr:DUF2207 domain-containing protein [Candidatus Berkelbacteria bacterium]
MKKYFALLLAIIVLFSFGLPTEARENVDYWYIKDFKSEIIINTDSSIDITENIVVDCGLAQKHGIFRTLPTFQQISSSEKIQSPIALTSIADFNSTPIKYSESSNRSDGTITWKIGDTNKTVSGVNNYRIKYHVKNAVRHNSTDFDELYWNLTGNFWDMEIDNFSAEIIFPKTVNNDNSHFYIYSGKFAEKNPLGITAGWTTSHQLEVKYGKTLKTGEGITLSTTFPKNIITPYVPGFWEKYGSYFYFLIPIIIFFLIFWLWKKAGRDPKINPVVVPEFEIPEKLAPIEMGLVLSDGILSNQYISASIINLAVNGILKIEKVGSKDFKITKLASKYSMSEGEKKLYAGLFESGETVTISDLKNKFYTNLPIISTASSNYLISKNWLVKNSRLWQWILLILSIICFGLATGFWAIDIILDLSLIISALVLLIFSFLMPRRSIDGAKLLQRIKGFKLYMNTAERYRQKFNEKENIFEKFLPYAIMFGMTKEWVKKMKDIYGEKYFATYHPVWFYGVGFESFDVDSIASEISSMSSNMASTISSSPSSSGSGGGGFSGGGGGGGGGGGW